MPASLAASLRLARLRDAPDSYRAQPIAPGAWRALNARQSFVTTFASSGVEVALHRREPARASLRLASVGCPGHQEPAADAPPERDGGEVRFRRGAVTEWYLHGEDGLEQGVSLAHEPCPGADRTRLEIAVEGELRPRSTGDGEVELVASAGAASLRYGKLWAVDAKGRELPAQMRVEEGRIAIEVETRGAAWPVVVDPLVWTQVAKLSDKLSTSAGQSVSVGGDLALVGNQYDDEQVKHLGSVLVFARGAGGWEKQARLVPTGGSDSLDFAHSVSHDGDTVLVGAPLDNHGNDYAGSAYVFVRTGATWSQQALLLASDGQGFERFGDSVSLSGDTALIGATSNDEQGDNAGAAYVFRRKEGAWAQEARLLASDGSNDLLFGLTVSLDGDTALVGALGSDDQGPRTGAAYVFARKDGTWAQQAKLLASDAQANQEFGGCVSLHGDTALIGAARDTTNGLASGAAYVFVRGEGTWQQQAKLLPDDGAQAGVFGWSVSVHGATALVGAPGAGQSASAGGAYVFERTETTWSQRSRLQPAKDANGKGAGHTVSLSGTIAMLGAPEQDSPSGAAYLFELRSANGDPCGPGLPLCQVACVDGVCCDTPCDGQCEACNAQGHCQPTAAGQQPTGARPACDPGTDSACRAACDGVHTMSCVFPDAGSPCGAASCASDVQTSMACDGAGTCASLVSTCAPFHCDDASQACLTSCSVDVDCQPGLQCEEQQCVPASQGAGGGGGSAGGDNGGAGPGGLGAGGSGAGGLGSAGSGAGDPGGGSGGSGGSAGQGPGGQTNAGTAGVSASGATGTGGSGGHSGDAGHAGSAVAAAGTAGSGGQGGAGQSGAGQAGAGQSGAGKGGAGQAGTDGGPQLVGVISAEGGCSCRATGGRSTGGSAVGLLALGLLAVRRRRAG